MASPKFDRDRAAKIIAEAMLAGDAQACAKHGIARRTLRNWRQRIGPDDPELAAACQQRKDAVESIGDWAEKLADAIRAQINFLKEAAEQAPRTDPDVIHSVAGALKILSDVASARRALDKKLGPWMHDAREALKNRPDAGSPSTSGQHGAVAGSAGQAEDDLDLGVH